MLFELLKKALAIAGILALSIIPTPSFSHGNAKYSECAFSRVVSGRYGGKASNAIFYCWDPNDPDVSSGFPSPPPSPRPPSPRLPSLPTWSPSPPNCIPPGTPSSPC